jgi:L-rhamnose mutarotase
MQRTCFTFELVQGREQEYERRHQQIWPEMVEALRANGISNYSIFRRGTTVVAYAECEPDHDTAFGAMGATQVNQRWSDWFAELIAELTDANGQLSRLDEVWHLD